MCVSNVNVKGEGAELRSDCLSGSHDNLCRGQLVAHPVLAERLSGSYDNLCRGREAPGPRYTSDAPDEAVKVLKQN